MSDTTYTIAPYIRKVLLGRKIEDLSFIQHPPAKWSWNLAITMSAELLDEELKNYATSQKNLKQEDILAHIGASWIKKSEVNFQAYPYIMAHATALLESLLMRSTDAMQRLYGHNASTWFHSILIAMHKQGIQSYKKWYEAYYDMRQSIETDTALQSHLSSHVRHFPHGWNDAKELRYIIDSESHQQWPLLPNHKTWLKATTWFDPSTMAERPVQMRFSAHAIDAHTIDEIQGRPYEAVRLTKDISVDLVFPHEHIHRALLTESLEFSHSAVAGSRPLHISIKIAHTPTLSENLAVQQTHALACAEYISDTLHTWLKYPLVREKAQMTPFQPSLSVECNIKDATSNALWNDVITEQLTQYISDIFKIYKVHTPHSPLQ